MVAAAAVAQTRNAVAEALQEARAGWSRSATAAMALVGFAALVPALPLDVGLDRLASDLYLAGAAVGLGIIVGLGGMPSLAQGGFVAVGAFSTALLTSKLGLPAEVALVAGAALAAVAGAAVGAVAGVLRPAIVAVVTWLVAWLVALGLAAFPSVSGGAQGITLGERTMSPLAHYEVGVGLVALAVFGFALLARSPAGIALQAARESRAAAASLGTPVARLRAATFAVGAGIGGLAGGLGVYASGVADAGAYEPLLSAKLFIALALGGAVAPAGGVVGVAVLVALGRIVDVAGLESLQAARVETLLVAVIILAALGAVDRGLLPSLADWRRERKGRTQFDLTSSPRPPAARAPLSLRAEGLAKRYGPVAALEGVNLDVAPSTVHALIGPNGSGKTTALRVLSGTVRPDEGAVVAGGKDLGDSGLRGRAARGIVGTLQATTVFPELTTLENAMVGAGLRLHEGGVARALLATPKARAAGCTARETAQQALETVGLGAARNTRADELPGAAQRRLMIAAALATQPRVLLLDEPSAGAGHGEVDVLVELVQALRESGLTILLVEHNLRLVRRVADEVTVLERGRVIARGTIDEVVADEAVHRAYLGGHRL